MTSKDIVELDGRDLFPALVDQFLDTSGDEYIAIFVHLSLITSSEEAFLGERFLVRFLVVQIPLCDVLSTNTDFAFRTSGEFFSSKVENANLYSLSNAHAAWLTFPRWERI